MRKREDYVVTLADDGGSDGEVALLPLLRRNGVMLNFGETAHAGDKIHVDSDLFGEPKMIL